MTFRVGPTDEGFRIGSGRAGSGSVRLQSGLSLYTRMAEARLEADRPGTIQTRFHSATLISRTYPDSASDGPGRDSAYSATRAVRANTTTSTKKKSPAWQSRYSKP